MLIPSTACTDVNFGKIRFLQATFRCKLYTTCVSIFLVSSAIASWSQWPIVDAEGLQITIVLREGSCYGLYINYVYAD